MARSKFVWKFWKLKIDSIDSVWCYPSEFDSLLIGEILYFLWVLDSFRIFEGSEQTFQMCLNPWSLLVTLLVSSENFIMFVRFFFVFSFFNQCEKKFLLRQYFQINTSFSMKRITNYLFCNNNPRVFFSPPVQQYLSEIFLYYHPWSKIHLISWKFSKRSSIRISKTFSIRYWILHWTSGRSSNWRHKKKLPTKRPFF